MTRLLLAAVAALMATGTASAEEAAANFSLAEFFETTCWATAGEPDKVAALMDHLPGWSRRHINNPAMSSSANAQSWTIPLPLTFQQLHEAQVSDAGLPLIVSIGSVKGSDGGGRMCFVVGVIAAGLSLDDLPFVASFEGPGDVRQGTHEGRDFDLSLIRGEEDMVTLALLARD